MTTFAERLDGACEFSLSLLCVGLDPDPALMPVRDVFQFNRAIVDATRDLVCAYKPNLAFYEVLGLEGLRALERTVGYVRRAVPKVIILGDAKRGDVGHTAAAYAKAMFEVWGFDAVTVNPYLGGDSLVPFLEYKEIGVFILCRTSNPGAGDFQDVQGVAAGRPRALYQQVAWKAKRSPSSPAAISSFAILAAGTKRYV